MKRDIDLCRQLLLDIEARGADCSVSVLRTDSSHDVEEHVRYHLRLLIDAGYLKEIDRTSSGVPCLRLTDAGHELIELSRREVRWRQAKRACYQHTGGFSLKAVEQLLLAWTAAPRHGRWRRRFVPARAETIVVNRRRPQFAPLEPIELTEFDVPNEPYAEDWDYGGGQVRYMRVRPHRRNGWQPNDDALNADIGIEPASESTLPEFLI